VHTFLPSNFFASPSMSFPTIRPSKITLPDLSRTASGKSSNGADGSASRSVSGNNSAFPMTLPERNQYWIDDVEIEIHVPLSSQMLPSASTFLPSNFLGSPSTRTPNGVPSSDTILPSLFTVFPFRIDKSGTSAGTSPSGSSSPAPSTLSLTSSPSGSSPSAPSTFGLASSGISPSAPSTLSVTSSPSGSSPSAPSTFDLTSSPSGSSPVTPSTLDLASSPSGSSPVTPSAFDLASSGSAEPTSEPSTLSSISGEMSALPIVLPKWIS
jgi:hypothetical protein